MPVYVKAGSILPFGPAVQYTSEKKWDNLEIRVYPGADADFTLYEDEGDNYNYEKGAFSQIRFHWDDAARTLTIGERKGDYKGMLKKRNFRILVVNRQSPSGDKEPTQQRKSTNHQIVKIFKQRNAAHLCDSLSQVCGFRLVRAQPLTPFWETASHQWNISPLTGYIHPPYTGIYQKVPSSFRMRSKTLII